MPGAAAMCLRHRYWFLSSLLLYPFTGSALAHSPFAAEGNARWAVLLSSLVIVLIWTLYVLGSKRQSPLHWRQLSFHCAMLLNVLAVLGPLDTWAETSTAWHMVQHMLFLVVITPLWVLSRPLPQLVMGGGRVVIYLATPLLRCTRHPMLIAYLHAGVLWFWHLPYFYTLALENPWWHLTEHSLFLVSAGLLWWVVLHSGRRHIGWALSVLLFTLMNTGFLGAVLTFAGSPLYGDARDLEDQQLAGLIMWVPGGLPYFIAAGWAGHRWSVQMKRRIKRSASISSLR